MEPMTEPLADRSSPPDYTSPLGSRPYNDQSGGREHRETNRER